VLAVKVQNFCSHVSKDIFLTLRSTDHFNIYIHICILYCWNNVICALCYWCCHVSLNQILNVKVCILFVVPTVFISPTCLCSLHLFISCLLVVINLKKGAIDLNSSPWWHKGAGGNVLWVLHLSTKVNSQLHGLTTLLHCSACGTH
jgi:hypothetical protein